jgi:hypothetical protein
MWKAPDGKLFSHAAAALIYELTHDIEAETYVKNFAPQTYLWLRHLERTHDFHRATRFDIFLGQMLRRQGYAHIEPA